MTHCAFQFKSMAPTTLFKDSEDFANVKLVFNDGIKFSHKIIVASASGFIKHLLIDFPVGDEITLYLPDHDKGEVKETLDNIASKKQRYVFNDINNTVITDSIKDELLTDDESTDYILNDVTETGFDVKVFDDKGESGSIKEDAIDSFCEEFENDEGVMSRIETLERKI